MFEKVNPQDSLVDREEGDIGEPEENIEQRHVHVVVETIIDQPAISVFQEDAPSESLKKLQNSMDEEREFRSGNFPFILFRRSTCR